MFQNYCSLFLVLWALLNVLTSNLLKRKRHCLVFFFLHVSSFCAIPRIDDEIVRQLPCWCSLSILHRKVKMLLSGEPSAPAGPQAHKAASANLAPAKFTDASADAKLAPLWSVCTTNFVPTPRTTNVRQRGLHQVQ